MMKGVICGRMDWVCACYSGTTDCTPVGCCFTCASCFSSFLPFLTLQISIISSFPCSQIISVLLHFHVCHTFLYILYFYFFFVCNENLLTDNFLQTFCSVVLYKEWQWSSWDHCHYQLNYKSEISFFLMPAIASSFSSSFSACLPLCPPWAIP